jgi:hypothetical protein
VTETHIAKGLVALSKELISIRQSHSTTLLQISKKTKIPMHILHKLETLSLTTASDIDADTWSSLAQYEYQLKHFLTSSKKSKPLQNVHVPAFLRKDEP